MQSDHDPAKAKQPVPKWVPVVLLGISTVALGVPIVFLKRQRAAQALTKAPPPRRRAGPSPIPRAGPTTAMPAAPRVDPIHVSNAPKAETPVDPGFNSALYSAKAFGVATTLATVGAFVGVWTVQASLGVQTAEEFAMKMKRTLVEKMPMLSSRIHRQIESEVGDDEAGEGVQTLPGEVGTGWTWEDAEGRLRAAYGKGGFLGWAEAALREVEAEGEHERLRRERLVEENRPA
ncbi:hypothetical protein BJ322DRAFT_1049749 [Thelephora terrestris]|uniref:Altered inheritance of mitochondria protein 11 n=1 Tax=Thelephora terrestris TaxID=56493 RepID=A0A9P6L9N2_9AGAM|nr:hypothetical protein BJ322DRAFT_1049749 [Thelephora terrestris]